MGSGLVRYVEMKVHQEFAQVVEDGMVRDEDRARVIPGTGPRSARTRSRQRLSNCFTMQAPDVPAGLGTASRCGRC